MRHVFHGGVEPHVLRCHVLLPFQFGFGKRAAFVRLNNLGLRGVEAILLFPGPGDQVGGNNDEETIAAVIALIMADSRARPQKPHLRFA